MDANANTKVLRLLRAAVAEAGSQSAWARKHGVSQAYVNHVLLGRRQAGPRVLAGLGLERVVGTRAARAKERA